tara:strand:+ start:1823 stop:2548 length:726 start_codon:yes stop_codon:yes gene_type:complete
MNVEMAIEIYETFLNLAKSDGIDIVVIRAEGKHFCAGGDLKDMIDNIEQPVKGEEDQLYRVNRRFGDLLTIINECPKTVISVVHGAARGGGFGIACVSDVVIGTEDSSYAMPETGFGLPGAQIIPFVVKRLGSFQTRRLVTTGDVISGVEAHELGLINYLCKNIDEAIIKLNETLSQIKNRSPNGIRESKRLINEVNIKTASDLLDDGARTVAYMSRNSDGAEGLKAFFEKRKPSWSKREG